MKTITVRYRGNGKSTPIKEITSVRIPYLEHLVEYLVFSIGILFLDYNGLLCLFYFSTYDFMYFMYIVREVRNEG